jgi:hypothetical protein
MTQEEMSRLPWNRGLNPLLWTPTRVPTPAEVLAEEEERRRHEDSGLGCLIGMAAVAASAAFMSWLGWLAWQAIKRQDVGELLVLAGILVALPAWHMVSQAFEREKKADLGLRVSDAWLRHHGRPRA